MTLLRELQGDAVNGRVDIATLLRKARVLAARLKNPEFEAWILHELNGYPNGVAVPEYRVLSVSSKAHLIVGRVQLPGAHVISSEIPEDFRHFATTAYMRNPITELSSLTADRTISLFQICWPQEVAANFGGAGYAAPVQCLSAWRELSAARLLSIIETVRNRLLEFVLKIESEAPDAGEAAPDIMPIPQDKVTRIFQMIVVHSGGVAHVRGKDSHGGSSAVNVGSMHDSQIQQAGAGSIQSIHLSQGAEDWANLQKLVKTLSEHLDELRLDEREHRRAMTQITTIKAQLEDDEPNRSIIAEAGRTLRNLTEGIIGNLISAGLQPSIWAWVSQVMHRYFPS